MELAEAVGVENVGETEGSLDGDGLVTNCYCSVFDL